MKQDALTWHSYLNRRMLICVFLGFSSGLPLFILLSLMQAWLAKSGLNVKALGLFALVMFPYTWKFLWSPLMDRFSFGSLGRRRGWMALTQGLLFVGIGLMGMLDPLTQVPLIAAAACAIAFLSASQDIVIDAYRREILPDNEQGLGGAIHVNAYKVAGMVPGALSLILAAPSSSPSRASTASRRRTCGKRWCCRSANSSPAAAGAMRWPSSASSFSTSSATAWPPRWPPSSTSTWASR
jgi:MFS transporter, PAT family, beta-lactamase induction signal transducer AmpG